MVNRTGGRPSRSKRRPRKDRRSSNWGWTAGAGVEWAFYGNWSARAELDYTRLVSQTFTTSPTAPFPAQPGISCQIEFQLLFPSEVEANVRYQTLALPPLQKKAFSKLICNGSFR
jgi:hypothetical protein